MSIIDKYQNIPSTCVSDALNGLNNLDHAIKPISDEHYVLGRAFTVKLNDADNLMLLKAIKEAKSGDILVVDANGNWNRAIMGDFVAGLAKTLGLKGVVIDGVIRDKLGIKELGLPVFCKGTTTAASKKYGVGEINVPISCGNISISPGDLIIGDADGVVCVPRNKEVLILERAKEKLLKDIERDEKIIGKADLAKRYIEKLIND